METNEERLQRFKDHTAKLKDPENILFKERMKAFRGFLKENDPIRIGLVQEVLKKIGFDNLDISIILKNTIKYGERSEKDGFWFFVSPSNKCYDEFWEGQDFADECKETKHEALNS